MPEVQGHDDRVKSSGKVGGSPSAATGIGWHPLERAPRRNRQGEHGRARGVLTTRRDSGFGQEGRKRCSGTKAIDIETSTPSRKVQAKVNSQRVMVTHLMHWLLPGAGCTGRHILRIHRGPPNSPRLLFTGSLQPRGLVYSAFCLGFFGNLCLLLGEAVGSLSAAAPGSSFCFFTSVFLVVNISISFM